MFKVKGQRSRSQRKVMYQQQTRYNTAIDRFSDFKLDMALRKRTGVTSGGLKLQCFRKCHVF